MGKFACSTKPAGAQIWVDGKNTGRIPPWPRQSADAARGQPQGRLQAQRQVDQAPGRHHHRGVRSASSSTCPSSERACGALPSIVGSWRCHRAGLAPRRTELHGKVTRHENDAHPGQAEAGPAQQPFTYPTPPGVRRARLAAHPRLQGRHRGGLGERALAAQAHRQEPARAEGGARRPAPRRPGGEHRAGPEGAGDDVAPAPAADAQHDERGGPVERPGAALHAAGVRRPPHRLAQPPQGQPRQPARGRDVGGRGPHPPLPDEGAGGDAAHLPAVLRPLHAHGPGRQRRAAGGQAQVRASGPKERYEQMLEYLRQHAHGARRGGLRRRHRQPAHPAARAVRQRAAGHPEHPGHPPGQQGPDGHPAALPAGQRARRRWSGWRRRPSSAAWTSRCTPTSTTRSS